MDKPTLPTHSSRIQIQIPRASQSHHQTTEFSPPEPSRSKYHSINMYSCANYPRGCRGRSNTPGGRCGDCVVCSQSLLPNPNMIYTINVTSPNPYKLQLTSPLLYRHSTSVDHHRHSTDGRAPRPWLRPSTGHGLRRTRTLPATTSDRHGHEKLASTCASTSTSALNLEHERLAAYSIRFCVTYCDSLEDRLELRNERNYGGR